MKIVCLAGAPEFRDIIAAAALSELHLGNAVCMRVEEANELFVINVGGYIDEVTAALIQNAKSVRYLEVPIQLRRFCAACGVVETPSNICLYCHTQLGEYDASSRYQGIPGGQVNGDQNGDA